VAAQLGAMRDENRRMWEQLAAEKRKNERMATSMARLWDVVNKGFPGMRESRLVLFDRKTHAHVFFKYQRSLKIY